MEIIWSYPAIISVSTLPKLPHLPHQGIWREIDRAGAGAGADGRMVKPPHIAESAFSMECEVMHWYDIKTDKGDPANTVIIGRVKMMHVVRLLLQY